MCLEYDSYAYHSYSYECLKRNNRVLEWFVLDNRGTRFTTFEFKVLIERPNLDQYQQKKISKQGSSTIQNVSKQIEQNKRRMFKSKLSDFIVQSDSKITQVSRQINRIILNKLHINHAQKFIIEKVRILKI